ncbi:C2H2-type zinc finger protein [Thermococcus prieurii]
MPECPYCGKWFKTKKGLQQHITKVHKVDTPFGKVLDPSTFDFMGKMKREEERAKRRRKKKKDPFSLF